MAEPTPAHRNPNFERGSFGIYNEIADNLIQIIQSSFMSEEGAELSDLAPVEYYPVDPQRINIDNVPALFVNVEGCFQDQNSMGAQRSGRKFSWKNNYAVTISYVLTGHNDVESSRYIKFVGAFVDHVINSNQNVNDIMNGFESIETTFDDKVLYIGGSLANADIYQRKVIYSNSSRSFTSTR